MELRLDDPSKRMVKDFGFNQNPFETTEAGGDDYYAAELLHETFVKPVKFENILGYPTLPKSTLVFALEAVVSQQRV